MENRSLLIEFNRGIPKTQKELDQIKNEFLLNDIQYKDILQNLGTPKIDLNQSNIQVNVVVGKSIRIIKDQFGFEEEEVELEHDLIEIDFYEEFERALKALFENYKTKFIRELDSKGIYTLEGLEGFKRFKLKNINDFIIERCNVSNIEESGKQLIKEFSEKVYDFISNFKAEDYKISNKLKLNLNKNQVIWLFLSMHDKGFISVMTPLELFDFLDVNVEYFDGETHKPMVKSRLQGNKFLNGHASTIESGKVLSKMFDKNFFNSSK